MPLKMGLMFTKPFRITTIMTPKTTSPTISTTSPTIVSNKNLKPMNLSKIQSMQSIINSPPTSCGCGH